MEQVQRISEWPVMGKVSTHGEGFGEFFGYNSQWEDVVIGLELNYTHGKFGGSQTGSMSRSSPFLRATRSAPRMKAPRA